jgi:uncharacterized membrane protein
MERLRSNFIAGILVTGPIVLTLYLTWWFVHFIDQSIESLLPPEYNPATYVPLPGLGLIIAVIALTFVGAVTAGYLGRLFVRLSERVVGRMPVIRGIYSAAKQIFETVLASKSNTFREVVLTEWPRPGMWTVAFVTAPPHPFIRDQAGSDSVGIYVPTTPNPTSGYLMYVRRRDIVTLPMTVEEGLKLVISGGIVAPPDRRPVVPEVEEAAVAVPPH